MYAVSMSPPVLFIRVLNTKHVGEFLPTIRLVFKVKAVCLGADSTADPLQNQRERQSELNPGARISDTFLPLLSLLQL